MSENNNIQKYNGIEPYKGIKNYKKSIKTIFLDFLAHAILFFKKNTLLAFFSVAAIMWLITFGYAETTNNTKLSYALAGLEYTEEVLGENQVYCFIDSMDCISLDVEQIEEVLPKQAEINKPADKSFKSITTVVEVSGVKKGIKKDVTMSYKDIKEKSRFLKVLIRNKLKTEWKPKSRKFGKKLRKKGNHFTDTYEIEVNKNDMIPLVTYMMLDEVLFNIPYLGSVTAGQADLESYWFNSNLAKGSNNGFGLKYVPRWDAAKNKEMWMVSHREGYVIAHDDSPRDRFIKFKNKWACVRFHTLFLVKQPRYRRCLKTHSYAHFAAELKRAGYATDRAYVEALKNRYTVLDIQYLEKLGRELRTEFNKDNLIYK
jgi:hypothetical protein